VEAEHGEECCVDLPLLLAGDSTDLTSETVDVDGAESLDKDSRVLASDVELWPERRCPSARRSRRHQHN
jgi:hypothetical protein